MSETAAMSTALSGTTALSETAAAQHTEQLIWLGAGSATEPAGLIANANQVVLVEARKAACQQLSAQFSASAKVSVKQALLSRDGGEVNFTEYNLAEFSALSPLAGLSELFPGLTAVKSGVKPSITLSELLAPLNLSGSNNTLVIDIADLSLVLLQQLQAGGSLSHFNQLYLQGSKLALYQGAPTQAQLTSYLEQQGFMLQAQDNTDPDLPWLHFSLNPLWQPLQQSRTEQQQVSEKIEQIQKQVAEQKLEFEQKLSSLTTQLANTVSEKETLQQQLSAAKVAAEKSQAELQGQLAGMDAELQQALKQRKTAEQHLSSVNEQVTQQKQALALVKQQLDDSLAQHAATTEQLSKVQGWLEHRKKQTETLESELAAMRAENTLLKSQQLTKGAMTELQANIEGMFKQQALQLQQAANALGQHVSKTQYEQESNLQNVLALQQFWQRGEQPLTLNAWSIQADTLNYLIKQINRESYDLIVEFGSGESTVVLAKALTQQAKALQDIVADNRLHYNKTNDAEQSVPQHYAFDLPAKIISFEQSEQYLLQTKQALAQHGLAGFVELVLAPLVPTDQKWPDDNVKSQLFYDCQLKLQKLAEVFAQRQVKILVVVDGPDSPEHDALVRYPALPILLNVFSAHKLQIVLDDSKREGEQHVMAKWSAMLEQRGLTHQIKHWPTAKGAVLIEVSP